MKNNEFKIFSIKNRTCYYFNDIIKLKDFVSDNTLIDEKSSEKLIYGICTELWLVENHCVLGSIK